MEEELRWCGEAVAIRRACCHRLSTLRYDAVPSPPTPPPVRTASIHATSVRTSSIHSTAVPPAPHTSSRPPVKRSQTTAKQLGTRPPSAQVRGGGAVPLGRAPVRRQRGGARVLPRPRRVPRGGPRARARTRPPRAAAFHPLRPRARERRRGRGAAADGGVRRGGGDLLRREERPSSSRARTVGGAHVGRILIWPMKLTVPGRPSSGTRMPLNGQRQRHTHGFRARKINAESRAISTYDIYTIFEFTKKGKGKAYPAPTNSAPQEPNNKTMNQTRMRERAIVTACRLQRR